MKKFRLAAIFLCMIFAVGSTSVLLSACSGQNGGGKVEVVYHLNYNDAGERSVEIPLGTSAVDWKATREGFKIKDWYTDEQCKTVYDFSQNVKSKLDLYAGWTVYEGKVPVTFDYNYLGARSSFTVSVDKGGLVEERYAPTNEKTGRFNVDLTGWYKDKACTQKWDFGRDTADSELTLYAGYRSVSTIPRDANGNIIYDNVQVNVWTWDNGRGVDVYKKLAEQFNKEYEGRIHVNTNTALLDQGTFAVRSQPTPEKSIHENTYHSIVDIFDMAGIEYSYDDWCEGALQDSIYKGALTSIPMFASVPYIVYNKTLMQKYNGNNPLPSNYTELNALLIKAYNGEHAGKPNFKSIMTHTQWDFKEATSSVAFVQNGAEYYNWDDANRLFENRWNNAQVKAGAVTALSNTYNLFGANGACHGGTGSSDSELIDAVNNGNALMCIVNYMTSNDNVLNKPNLDVMSVSGLFTDGTGKEAMRIPIHTYGLAFYKHAGNVSDVQLAAGAVFVDYCSRHSDAFTEQGWYPIRKSCNGSENFDAKYKELLAKIGDPSNFYTHYGYTNSKRIINGVCAEKYIVPMLFENIVDLNKRTEEIARAMATSIGFEISN